MTLLEVGLEAEPPGHRCRREIDLNTYRFISDYCELKAMGEAMLAIRVWEADALRQAIEKFAWVDRTGKLGVRWSRYTCC